MLNRIVLENFQRHARLDLPLHPVTVLWGPSGAGKSSVIRALRWLCLNDLPGDPTSFGAESCRASVYAKADRLTRFRTKSENGYKRSAPAAFPPRWARRCGSAPPTSRVSTTDTSSCR
jgi:AAA15 family ATPase/GTPase